MTTTTIVQTVMVMLLWASCFPLITVGIEYASHLTFAALRALIAGLALTSLAFILRRPLPKRSNDWFMVILIGLGATSLGFLGMFHAAELVSPGIATVIANTQPLMAAVLAGFILGEHLTGRSKIALAVSFLGIITIASPHLLGDGSTSFAVGLAYIILAALGITLSNVLIKKISGRVDIFMAMGLQMLFGSLPLMVVAAMTETPTAVQWSYTFITVLLVLSLPGTALVYWLWCSVLEKVPLNRANAFSFLIPVFGLTIGMLFYGEGLTELQVVGVFITVAGVAIVVHGGPHDVSQKKRPIEELSFAAEPKRHK